MVKFYLNIKMGGVELILNYLKIIIILAAASVFIVCIFIVGDYVINDAAIREVSTLY